jgi:crossover junction endodeoxyribonuclease RuvC
MIAKQTVELDAAKARQALRLVEQLEDLDDVSRVTANFDIPEELFAEVAGDRPGIDPGTAALGYGIVESSRGPLREVDHGCLVTSPDTALPERLLAVHAIVDELIAVHSPRTPRDRAPVLLEERPDGVRGRASPRRCAPCCRAAPRAVVEATPNEVKSAIAGYGAADKEQVQRMVQLVLGMAELPRPDDAADALAIAVWGAHSRPGGLRSSVAGDGSSGRRADRRGESGFDRAVKDALAKEAAEARASKRNAS